MRVSDSPDSVYYSLQYHSSVSHHAAGQLAALPLVHFYRHAKFSVVLKESSSILAYVYIKYGAYSVTKTVISALW